MKQLLQFIGTNSAEKYERLRVIPDNTVMWGHDIQLGKGDRAALATTTAREE